MHDTLAYFANDPVLPPLAPPRPDLRPALRLQRALRAPPVTRRGRARARARCSARCRATEWRQLRQPAGALRLDVGPPRASRCCSWAASWPAAEWSHERGARLGPAGGRPARRRAGPGPARSTGSTPTSPPCTCATSTPTGFAWIDANDVDLSTLAFERRDPGGDDVVVCVANLAGMARHGYRLGLPAAGAGVERAQHRRRRLRGQGGWAADVPAEPEPWHGRELGGADAPLRCRSRYLVPA